jgi:predicted NUDIX family NTP pyrophosphohydrolase
MKDRVVFVTGAKGGLGSYITRRAGSTRNLPDQSGHKLGEISPVVQLFVIDWTPACGEGSSFNPKDRASWFHFQRRGDIGFSCHRVQLVLGLNQRNVVFAFKKRKNRLDF